MAPPSTDVWTRHGGVTSRRLCVMRESWKALRRRLDAVSPRRTRCLRSAWIKGTHSKPKTMSLAKDCQTQNQTVEYLIDLIRERV